MHTVEEIRAEYNRLDKICGVDTSHIEIIFSDRMTRKLGYCRIVSHTPIRIAIASFLRSENTSFWDTVRHEYAHAVVSLRDPKHRAGHDAVWKDVCREVGCSPSRLAKISPAQKRVMEKRVKYVVACPNCGRQWLYYRAGRVVTAMKKQGGSDGPIYCRHCGKEKGSNLILKEK